MNKIINNLDSSVFEQTISKIIETDNKAKDIIKSAKDCLDSIDSEAQKKLDNYKAERMAQAKEQINAVKSEYDKKYSERMDDSKSDSTKTIDKFGSYIMENKQKWETEIFNRIINN